MHGQDVIKINLSPSFRQTPIIQNNSLIKGPRCSHKSARPRLLVRGTPNDEKRTGPSGSLESYFEINSPAPRGTTGPEIFYRNRPLATLDCLLEKTGTFLFGVGDVPNPQRSFWGHRVVPKN